MVDINLLPWRDHQKNHERKILKKMLLAAVFLPLFLNFLVYWFVTARIEILNTRNASLQEEVNKLEALQQQFEEMRRQHEVSAEWLQQLTQYQSEITHLFVELIKLPMKNVCFTAMSRVVNTITFLGYTRSAADLKELLAAWEANHYFSEIKIENLHEQVANQVMRFRFTAIEKNRLVINLMKKESESKDAV